MKKYFILSCLTLAFFSHTNLRAQKVSSYISENWNGSAWVKASRVTYSYDANFNQTIQLVETWTGSAWQNNNRATYNNDSNGDDTLMLNQIWISSTSTWSTNGRFTYAYAFAHRPIFQLYQAWNGSSFQNNYKRSYVYDNNLYQLSDLKETWNTGNSSWQNSTLSYNQNNAVGDATMTLGQNWITAASTWSNNSRSTNIYTAQHKPGSYFSESWNGTGWQNATSITWGYDVNLNPISQLYQYWSASTWQNQLKVNHSLNANSLPLVTTYQSWNTTANTWTNSSRTTWTYMNSSPTVLTNTLSNIFNTSADCGGSISSDGGSPVTARGLCWSTQPNPTTADFISNQGPGNVAFYATMANLSPGTLYYVRAFATNSLGTSYGNQRLFHTSGATRITQYATTGAIKIYPQPTTDKIQLDIKPEMLNSDILFFDESGKQVLKARLTKETNNLDVSGLASGIYFLRLQNGERLKMIKQ